jgi:hypothetical protein
MRESLWLGSRLVFRISLARDVVRPSKGFELRRAGFWSKDSDDSPEETEKDSIKPIQLPPRKQQLVDPLNPNRDTENHFPLLDLCGPFNFAMAAG